jgi:hypothetical protein
MVIRSQWVEVTYEQDYAEVGNFTTTIAAADTWTDQTGFFTLAKTVTGISRRQTDCGLGLIRRYGERM